MASPSSFGNLWNAKSKFSASIIETNGTKGDDQSNHEVGTASAMCTGGYIANQGENSEDYVDGGLVMGDDYTLYAVRRYRGGSRNDVDGGSRCIKDQDGTIHKVRRAGNGEVYVVELEYSVPDASQGPNTVNATSTSSEIISEPQGAIWSTLSHEEEHGSEKGDLVPLVGCVFTQGEEWGVPCTAPIIKTPPGEEPMCEQHFNAWKEWKSRTLSTSRQLGRMGQQQRRRTEVKGGGFQALSELAEAGKAPPLEDISAGNWRERYIKGVYD